MIPTTLKKKKQSPSMTVDSEYLVTKAKEEILSPSTIKSKKLTSKTLYSSTNSKKLKKPSWTRNIETIVTLNLNL
jgi:hypothetical protein